MKHILILFIAILFICGNCENLVDDVHSIRIRNKSAHTISVYADYILPDTSLPQYKPWLKTIAPDNFKDIYDNDVGDKEFKRLDDERLTIFVLSKDTLDKYSWDTIRENYMILKRYEILSKDLESYASITYP